MFTILLELVLKNWKTTIAGIMGILVWAFGKDVIESIPQETWTMIGILLQGIALALARDSGVKVENN